MSWTLQETWNKALETREERELKPRENIWASELGGSYIDRYHKMKGVKQTNPPNARSLRKFEAGNLAEWVVGLVLKRAGILKDLQKWVGYQYEGLLPVSGKLDYIAGGGIDWEKSKNEIEKLELPDFFNRATNQIITHLQSNYPDGLNDIILEIKSCSSFMFERYEKHGLKAAKNHKLQTYHYLKGLGLPEAHLVYISKDDLRLLELGIYNPSNIEDEYKTDIRSMTYYFKNDIVPPKEELIILNGDTCKFSTNWKIEYSSYLTMIYGFDEPINYREKYDRTVASWNRTLGRVIAGKNITDLNKKTIEEIKANGFDLDGIISKARESNITIEENVEDD